MSLKFVSRLHERSLSTQLNGNPLVPGFDRRSFLRFSLGAGAAALSSPCRAGAEQVDPKQDSGRAAKAVILLWMAGGPSQIETWDPKPGSRNAGEFKALDTTGGQLMKFSDQMKVCATQGKNMTIVRSVNTHEGAHERGTSLMHIGINPVQGLEIPPTGTVVSYEKARRSSPCPTSSPSIRRSFRRRRPSAMTTCPSASTTPTIPSRTSAARSARATAGTR